MPILMPDVAQVGQPILIARHNRRHLGSGAVIGHDDGKVGVGLIGETFEHEREFGFVIGGDDDFRLHSWDFQVTGDVSRLN